MPKQPKLPVKRAPGRPKLHDQAKSSTVLVRLSTADRQRLDAAAQSKGQTVSEWLRSTINGALEA